MAQLDGLLHKKVTRKEFLAHIGLGILALLGLPGMVGLLAKTAHSDTEPNDGFGSGIYR